MNIYLDLGLKTAVFGCLTNAIAPLPITLESCSRLKQIGQSSRDNTNWSAGRAEGPCIEMKNVDFRQAAEKRSPLARPFLQPSLMCILAARPSVWQAARRKFKFFIW